MSDRFFLAAPPVAGRAELVGDEARHLARVLRAAVGDAVAVFDGHGREWPATIAAIGRDRVALEVGPPRESPPPRRRLTLAVALPKGDRQKWMAEKLTEIGVTRLVPLVTTRGVAATTSGTIERLTRVVIEACKQCGRNTLLEITAPRALAAVLADVSSDAIALVADPTGEAPPSAIAHHPGELLGLVGPEGGFTPEELSAARAAGCQPVLLGPHVMRVETAAIALAATLATGR